MSFVLICAASALRAPVPPASRSLMASALPPAGTAILGAARALFKSSIE